MLKNLFTHAKIPTYSDDTVNILRLIRSENVGCKTFTNLIKLYSSAGNALEHIEELSLKGGRSKPIKICSKAKAEKELELLTKNKSYLITYKDINYSQLLLQIHDFPPILSYKGNIELLTSEKIIAIVGARNSSINGRSFAGKVARELVANDFITVSGLARGIDTAVHIANTSKTIAVIAGGIDHIYPPENEKLFNKIAEEGLLLVELPIGSKPLSQHFPQRNRIISGLSLATAVIEAGVKSGSLITARFALEQNRDVFATPGFPLDPRCMGSNKLIKTGAYLLESAEDIISNVISHTKLKKSLEESETYSNNFNFPRDSKEIEVTDENRKQILTLLSSSSVTYEQLVENTGLPVPVIYAVCLELELAGKIARYPGNRISLIIK